MSSAGQPETIRATTSRSLPLLVGILASQVLAAVTYLVSARDLGPAPFGAAMGVVGVATFLATLLDFGGAAGATRDLAPLLADAARYMKDFGARLTTVLLSILLSGAWWITAPTSLRLLGLCLPLASLVAFEQFAIAPLRARSMNVLVATVLTVDKLITILLVLLASREGLLTPVLLLLILCSGAAVGAVVAVAVESGSVIGAARGRLKPRMRLPWSGTRNLGIGGVATGAQFLDAELIKSIAGAAQAGQYAAVARWSAPIGMISTALSLSMYPVLVTAKSDVDAWRRLRSGLRLLVLPALGLVALALMADRVVTFLLGTQYLPSIEVVRVLAIGLLAAMVNQPLTSMLQARRAEHLTAAILVVGVLLQLTLILILSSRWGSLGAALAFAVAQFSILVLLMTAVLHLLSRPGKERR
jgi:O-antigen/teichoic acid export membrane protein